MVETFTHGEGRGKWTCGLCGQRKGNEEFYLPVDMLEMPVRHCCREV